MTGFLELSSLIKSDPPVSCEQMGVQFTKLKKKNHFLHKRELCESSSE